MAFVVSDHVLQQSLTRPFAACDVFGDKAFYDACKGLSRPIDPRNEADLELFARQLRDGSSDIVATDLHAATQDYIFALSYHQLETARTRYKFREYQWRNLKAFMAHLAGAGVERVRFWLDQCVGQGNRGQGSWANTGILPYTTWPVVSLGVKRNQNADRTTASEQRYWLFVEELAGLWGAGLIITGELNYATAPSNPDTLLTNSCARCSLNIRKEQNPHESMEMLFRNLFHGAADQLETGWDADKRELKDMARANFFYGKFNAVEDRHDIIVGSDWKIRLARERCNGQTVLNRLLLPDSASSEVNGMYLDGAAKVTHGRRWLGVFEFLSGRYEGDPDRDALKAAFERPEWYNIEVNNRDEFQFLRLSAPGDHTWSKSLWLIVKMKGKTTPEHKFGSVQWTKVMHGKVSAMLATAFRNNNFAAVTNLLPAQLGYGNTPIALTSKEKVENRVPAWTIIQPVISHR